MWWKTCSMLQDTPYGDLLWRSDVVMECQPTQIVFDRRVEIDPARFGQSHDRGCRDRLGDRA